MPQAYDIIGDIHGYIEPLEALLKKLGYQKLDGVYQHPARKAIFVGDFIDRGPGQREVVDLARAMVESGNAMAVMGNHEFNAICFATPDINGGYLRKHSEKNIRTHKAFLEAYPDLKERWKVLDWFKTLPLFLDFDEFRVIHACWDKTSIENIAHILDDNNCLTDEGYVLSCDEGSVEHRATEILMKGPEVELPEGSHFYDKSEIKRLRARVAWWVSAAHEATDRIKLGHPVEGMHAIQKMALEHDFYYPEEAKPVFFGHYWEHGDPILIAPNAACLDYSVANDGKLVAYSWDGEQVLDSEKFTSWPEK